MGDQFVGLDDSNLVGREHSQMKNAFYLLLVLIGLVVALVTISIGQFFAGVSIRVLEGVKRVRTWRDSK
jgi:hypothetical protein